MEIINKLSNSTIIIDDTHSDILELRAAARRMKENHDVKVIFVDYLQLIKGQTSDYASRKNEMAMISGSLKAMAKELNISVVVLVQLCHNVAPKLGNLCESGAIEQDADIMAFLHRDRTQQYYLKDGDEDRPLPAEFIIAKNRNGGTGTVDLMLYPAYMRFANVQSAMEQLMSEPLIPELGRARISQMNGHLVELEKSLQGKGACAPKNK